MEKDAIDPEKDLEEVLADEEPPTMTVLDAKGSLSDVEIDYETRSEISEDDEDKAEDTDKIASKTSVEDGRSARDNPSSKKSESSKRASSAKTNGKRRESRTEGSKDEESRSTKRLKKEETSKSINKSEIGEDALQTLSQNAKFFLMKTSDSNNLKVSQERQVWFTDPQNVTILNMAADSSKDVILVFSAKWSGKFSGFALLKGRSKSDDPPRDWAPSIKTLGGLFHVKWLSRKELMFASSNHLRNPCSGGKLVSICVDGQEIEQKVGLELCLLLLRKGVVPKESPNQRECDLPVVSELINAREDDKKASKRKSKSTKQISDDGKDLRRRKSSERNRSSSRRDITHSRLDRESYLSTNSPHKDFDRDGRRSSYSKSNGRGRSPVRRKRRTRNEHSIDRIERSPTHEKYQSRKTSRRGSIGSIDLRHKTSLRKNQIRDSFDEIDDLSPLSDVYARSPSRRSDSRNYEYLSDDDLDVTDELPSMAGRFVFERSPIRETVESPTQDLLSDEEVSYHREELENKTKATPERYCTIVPSIPFQQSPSPERISEVSRQVYETHESLGKSPSRSRLEPTYDDDEYHKQNKTYVSGHGDSYSSNESISGRHTTHRRTKSPIRSVYADYSSCEARSRSERRSPSLVRSNSSQRVYESHEASRKTLRSRDRSQTTLRDCSFYESTRMKSHDYKRQINTDMDYQQESTGRTSARRDRSREEIRSKKYSRISEREEEVKRHEDWRMMRSRDVISRDRTPSQEFIDRDGHSRRTEESSRRYHSRDSDSYDVRRNKSNPVRVSGSESRSSYSEGITDMSSLHRSSVSSRTRRGSIERQDDRIKYYRDEHSSYDRKRKLSPVREPRLSGERAPERVQDYRSFRSERSDHNRSRDYDSYRPESDRGRNHYYGHESQNPAPSSHLPAPRVNYYQGNPPPILPPVSSKLLEPSTRPSPSTYNPALPPPMMPPAPSKYIDDLPAPPPVPPRFQQGGTIPPPPSRGRSFVGSWAPGISNDRDTPSQKLSAEEFIELCRRNKPIRPSTTFGPRRSYQS